MGDFLESAKSFFNSAVSRTSWEAQKQLRLRGKQGELDKLLEQRMQLLNDLSLTAMNLYQQGSLTDAQLSRLCASIIELDNDIRKREEQIEEIKKEAYPAEQFAPGPTPNYTAPGSSSQHTQDTPNTPPAGAYYSPTGDAQQGQTLCPHCNQPVRPGALYCRNCGGKLR
ncbi:hypothetical protein EI42_00365 [Thermosporothrix hazakensis]|jgi:hypothetical protein|uniref:Zinc-ribbon domain-containing protein n=2 Tax=Thermosporothrix hazakensis TaxID=644383 RepID=A0A326UUA7_THEHA|nr:zinc ribbon domain-containing protein [Thermosporothrix hazakensis]PZW36193.1 hypothetical protein EI42_00365 [Thermosporothrix hazakensis]GCE46844.1 hypothetical protein KTH_17130 [Thermosporothrix hazakensis]